MSYRWFDLDRAIVGIHIRPDKLKYLFIQFEDEIPKDVRTSAINEGWIFDSDNLKVAYHFYDFNSMSDIKAKLLRFYSETEIDNSIVNYSDCKESGVLPPEILPSSPPNTNDGVSHLKSVIKDGFITRAKLSSAQILEGLNNKPQTSKGFSR